jgi:RNA polymerase sigma-70 factor (ECF subfamily)
MRPLDVSMMLETLSLEPPNQTSASRKTSSAWTAERLVVEQHVYVARLVARLLGWPSDVDDVVQEVFLAATKNLPRFREEAKVETWLGRIAINAVRTHQRKVTLGLGLLKKVMAWTREANPKPSLAEQDEAAQSVRRSVQRLGQKDRELMVLHYLEERSVDEITELLGIKKNAVEVRLTRARAKLKTLLTEQGMDHAG